MRETLWDRSAGWNQKQVPSHSKDWLRMFQCQLSQEFLESMAFDTFIRGENAWNLHGQLWHIPWTFGPKILTFILTAQDLHTSTVHMKLALQKRRLGGKNLKDWIPYALPKVNESWHWWSDGTFHGSPITWTGLCSRSRTLRSFGW